jgi:hypothetical protein
MARQLLVEGLKGSFPFIADRTKIVVENLSTGGTRTRIPGRFSVCDCINGNGRRYGKRVWEKNLQPGSLLTKAISENAAWGLLEHPKDGQVTLQSPICIRTTAAQLQESKDEKGSPVWEVVGEISILNPQLVPEAARLTAMIQEGYCPRVSSRGFGSLVRDAAGVDDVQEDYVCEGWDVVMKPSFESAVLTPQPESVKTTPASTPPLSEATVPPSAPSQPPATATTAPAVTKPNLEAVEPGSQTPSAAAKTPAKPANESTTQEKAMNANEIKAQITAIRSQDPSRLNPAQFAESMSQLSTLHQEVANFVAEDSKRSWEGQQLHETIRSVERTWSETQLAPGKKASKLQEDNTKLMQVVKAVAQTALSFKNRIGESMKNQNRQAALLAEVTERGQAWRQQAKALEEDAAKYKRRFMLASEALHVFARKYKADVTELGKAHLNLEFKEKAETPEFKALLKEAAKPKALVPIRLALEGKITVEVAKSILEGKTSLNETLKGIKSTSASPAPGTTNESKTAAQPAAGNKTPTATVSGGVTILTPAPTDPRGLTEAVDMVNRLSKAIAG